MREIYEMDLSDFSNAVHIVSEPGDMTRYDYYIIVNGDEYMFFSIENNFNYPHKLNYYEMLDLDAYQINELAKKENYNPRTLKECIETMMAIRG